MATAHQGPTAEVAVAYRDMMLQGLLREMETTRKVLAAVPDGKRDYRPDPNARTGWELARHIASVDVQFLDGIADGKFVMEGERTDLPNTSAELAAWYEENFKRAAERVQALAPEQLLRPIDFYGVFNLPGVFYLGFVNNHSIHHRGQLSSYLRPMGGKVPSIYGGSYDEPWQGQETASSAA